MGKWNVWQNLNLNNQKFKKCLDLLTTYSPYTLRILIRRNKIFTEKKLLQYLCDICLLSYKPLIYIKKNKKERRRRLYFKRPLLTEKYIFKRDWKRFDCNMYGIWLGQFHFINSFFFFLKLLKYNSDIYAFVSILLFSDDKNFTIF